jgi:predicted HTH domain antitoxin
MLKTFVLPFAMNYGNASIQISLRSYTEERLILAIAKQNLSDTDALTKDESS